jgi:hypothetical protein
MKFLGHPLFIVFASTLLVFLAGIWWLLRRQREKTHREQRASLLRESEPTVMEFLHEVPPDTIPLDEDGPVSPRAMALDRKDATRQTIKRKETRSGLAVLSELIEKQRTGIASARATGLDVSLLEKRLKVLTDTHEQYSSALKDLLTGCVDDEKGKGGNQ